MLAGAWFSQRAMSTAKMKAASAARAVATTVMTPRAITAGAFFVVSQAAWICVVATDE